jgi:hypothetical protein
MKRSLLVSMMVALVFCLATGTAALAATTYPSAAGDWLCSGRMSMKATVKGEGSIHDGGYVEDAMLNLNEDGTFDTGGEFQGTWVQNKNKITLTVDPVDLASDLEDLIYNELGFYVDVTIKGASMKATIFKDGLRLSNFNFKFKFAVEYNGKSASGTYSATGKAVRSQYGGNQRQESFTRSAVSKSIADSIMKEMLPRMR